MAISKRLKHIISLVTEGYIAADIGTDHGYVPISLLRERSAETAIAADISRGSLEKAVINGYRAGVRIRKNPFSESVRETYPDFFAEDDRSFLQEEEDCFFRKFHDGRDVPEGLLDCRLSDGLDGFFPGEAECFILSGMGGLLMTRILSGNPDVVRAAKELILSPHRDADLVREYVKEQGFRILYEEELTDKKKRYTVMKAVK